MNKLLSSTLALSLASMSALAAGFRATPSAEYKEDAWSFGVAADLTGVSGTAKEHVFSPKSEAAGYAAEFHAPYADRRHQLSRLDWDISASMVGFAGSARRGRLSLNLGVWYGGSGTDDWDMKDYDWMSGDHLPYDNYSKSETELTDAWMYDANISYDVWRGNSSVGYVFLGAREQRWKWTCDGRNEYLYPENGYVPYSDTGHICDYRQLLMFAYAGVGGTWKLTDRLDLSAYASWAPAVKGRDRDNHIAAEKEFRGSFDYDEANVYAAGLSLDWHVSQSATICFAFDWQKASIAEGDTTLDNYGEGEWESEKDSAGIENEYLAFTIGVDCAL